MKQTLLIVICTTFLASCSMQPYQAPSAGKMATILFDGSKMTPIPFSQKKLNVQVFNQCYEKRPSEGVLGGLTIKEADFSKNGIKVSTDKKIFISYGILNTCMLNWSLIPKEGTEYLATFDNVFGGCEGSLVKLEDGKAMKEATAKFLKLEGWKTLIKSGDNWRQCKHIPDQI